MPPSKVIVYLQRKSWILIDNEAPSKPAKHFYWKSAAYIPSFTLHATEYLPQDLVTGSQEEKWSYEKATSFEALGVKWALGKNQTKRR